MDRAPLNQIVLDFLNGHRKALLAVVSPDHRPKVSLMLYAIDENFHFYFGTRRAFKKYAWMQENAQVSLAVAEEALDPLRVVEVQGVVHFIAPDKTEETLRFFESKNPSKYYVKGAEDFVMFRVEPEHVRWLDATSGELTMTDVELVLPEHTHEDENAA
ncbi:MAG: pyridoxamine 5'-phosphate oxidase family protein [Candidatus Moranbacteria bacterium]|nr:pyridoxamine 5'-phosphate oxidase family protein [Candidatus Moranbacteria bacterium]MBP6034468.1 pyridoxamine 5'-phosphate oxidase family protein [Candidatus Moranbacteria bacterium]MBP7696104.1 pyridoxamine 5'-phosphate oxidase family protein [Candidatus Moranbacteria bacterium]